MFKRLIGRSVIIYLKSFKEEISCIISDVNDRFILVSENNDYDLSLINLDEIGIVKCISRQNLEGYPAVEESTVRVAAKVSKRSNDFSVQNDIGGYETPKFIPKFERMSDK